MKNLSDEELMLRIQGGESRLLSILFERHHRRLYNHFLRLSGNPAMAEDLVSEIFLRILKYGQSYRSESKFTTWLFQVARNAYLDQVAKQRPEDSLDDLQVPPAAEVKQPDETHGHQQETELIRLALARLPERKRQVLILSRFQEMKYDEIATVMGCTLPAVKILVHRSLKELREIYEEMRKGGNP